jgi:lipopolysaccharide/colanic/teichoic acid biosynthesis glycosyltransferase
VENRQYIFVKPGNISKRIISILESNLGFDYYCYDGKASNPKELLKVFASNDIIFVFESIISQMETQQLVKETKEFFKAYRIKFVQASTLFEDFSKRVPLLYNNGVWMSPLDISNIKPSILTLASKRIFDLVFLLIFSIPAFVLVIIGSILIKLTSKGPVFFKQVRVGKDCKPFTIFKLRTMNNDSLEVKSHTTENDERIFPVGKVLRKLKIDELPQLYNILKNEMSFIGPRPEREDLVSEFQQQCPHYQYRSVIKPGISGWAQVNNPKATPEESMEKLEYDLYYIKKLSLWFDLEICLKTFVVIFRRDSL